MRKSQFTDSLIVAVLKQAEMGVMIPDLFRVYGISSATFNKQRLKLGGMNSSMMKWFNELEDDNRRLKSTQAEEQLNSDLRREAMKGGW